MPISSINQQKISRILLTTRQEKQLHSQRNIACYYKNHQLIFNFVFLVTESKQTEQIQSSSVSKLLGMISYL